MKKILVALDGSLRAPHVLAYAVNLASAMGGSLLLFRSYTVPPDLRLAWPLPDEALELGLRERAQAELDELGKAVPKELLGGVRVSAGDAWQAICSVAREEGAELIVLGSHGYGGIDLLIGTTAARVVNHADRPVLVVRPIGGA